MVMDSEILKMDIVKNNQIKHEHMSWLRLIEFFRQENALLKYRLSEMVDNNDDSQFLQIAEYFQNEFLLKDEALKKLIKELQDYSDIIQNKPDLSKQLINAHNNLRNDILQFEEKYTLLSKEFNEKMLQSP
jgi:DNA integrity scanning protein DisA with diadenylate cyclase activity